MNFRVFIPYFILATVSVLFGAVETWVWSIYVALMLAAFLIALWQGELPRWRPGLLFWLTAGAFLVVTFFQCVPLPDKLLTFFSPQRANYLAESQSILEIPHKAGTISYQPMTSFGWWLMLLGLVLFAPVLRVTAFGSRRNFKRVVWILLILGICQAVYGLLQALLPQQIGVLWVDPGYAYQGQARGTFINRNHFAGFLEMVWLMGLGVTLSLGEWEEEGGIKAALSGEHMNYQVLYLLMVSLMLLALLFSRSRGGITGAILGLITFVWLVSRGTKRFRMVLWVLIGLVILMVGMYGSRIGFGSIIERFFQISPDQSRLVVWQDSLPMVGQHFWGIGLNNYQFLSPLYLKSIFSGEHYVQAHNDYLQLLIEGGWVGAVPLVAGFFYFLIRSFGQVKRVGMSNGRLQFFVGCGALSGLVSMAFHSFFDFNLQIPANAVYFVTLITLVYGCFWEEERSLGRRVIES